MSQETESSTPANAGKAILSSFKYIKGYCIVTLDNGVSGIIGQAVDMPLATMLQLKGQAIQYEHRGTVDGRERYSLEFAL
jgi:hypothetical protein